MIKNDWKKGAGFYLLVLANPISVLASRNLGNDALGILLILLALLNVVIRFWSAIDAAVHTVVRSKEGRSKLFRFGIVFCCLFITFILNNYGGEDDAEKRFPSFVIHSKNTLLEPDLPAGTRLLAVGPEYWEKDLKVGDFVVVYQKDPGLQREVPLVLKVYGLEGEPCPFDGGVECDKKPETGKACIIPKGHYLVGATDPDRLKLLVPAEKIAARALYVYWPVGRVRKL